MGDEKNTFFHQKIFVHRSKSGVKSVEALERLTSRQKYRQTKVI